MFNITYTKVLASSFSKKPVDCRAAEVYHNYPEGDCSDRQTTGARVGC